MSDESVFVKNCLALFSAIGFRIRNIETTQRVFRMQSLSAPLVSFSDNGAGRFNVWRRSVQRHFPVYKHALSNE
jgi:hypothetical protein